MGFKRQHLASSSAKASALLHTKLGVLRVAAFGVWSPTKESHLSVGCQVGRKEPKSGHSTQGQHAQVLGITVLMPAGRGTGPTLSFGEGEKEPPRRCGC